MCLAPNCAAAEFAGTYARTKAAHAEHERAKGVLKRLTPEDAREPIGYGIRAKRSKSGAICIELLGSGELGDNQAGHATMQ